MPNRKAKEKATAEFLQAEKAARFILSKTKLRPKIALVLGSGLGAFADEFENAKKIPYAKIPHFPRSTAIGHAGQLVLEPWMVLRWRECRAVFICTKATRRSKSRFRFVCSRGWAPKRSLSPTPLEVSISAIPGRLVAIRDHINLQGANPLIGPNEDRFALASRI
jgi:purine-nucleoside phosphorylase